MRFSLERNAFIEFLSFFVNIRSCLKALASYAFTLLVCFSLSAQNDTPLLKQVISTDHQIPNDLATDLEECFIIKNTGWLPGFKLKFNKILNKEINYWDEEKLGRSAFKINQKLKQAGYFHSTVELVRKDKGHSAIAKYKVSLGHRWTLGEIDVSSLNSGIESEDVLNLIMINFGDDLDVDQLEDERERIASHFQNLGFATFNEGFIHFELDTSRQFGVADVLLSIRGQKLEGSDDFSKHKKVHIGNIEFDQSQMHKKIDGEILDYLVLLQEGQTFDPQVFEKTYRRLSSVSSISSVQLLKEFNVLKGEEYDEALVNIALKSATRYNFSFALDMTRADTRFGPLTKITWKDRNLLGRGDVLTLTGLASYSSTQLFSNTELNLLPNTGEFGLQLSYRTIGIPFRSLSKLPKSTYAHSEVILTSAFEDRPEYNRMFANLFIRADWMENADKLSKIIIDPFRLSYVKIESEENFAQWLDTVADPLTQYRFTDYTNLGSSITWSQGVKNKILASVEWSGMLSGYLAPLLGFDNNSVPLIRYFRLDGSWSRAFEIQSVDYDEIVVRLRGGSAWVGKGTDVLPYDRAFFAGGANGVRGWPIRGLGGSDDLLGVGDLRIDASVEHRKGINDYLTIATFADVGNVWVHDDEYKLNDIALSAGLGFRFDLEFFLFRIDLAARLYDPTQNQELRWLTQGPLKGGVHFGLGHPF